MVVIRDLQESRPRGRVQHESWGCVASTAQLVPERKERHREFLEEQQILHCVVHLLALDCVTFTQL